MMETYHEAEREKRENDEIYEIRSNVEKIMYLLEFDSNKKNPNQTFKAI